MNSILVGIPVIYCEDCVSECLAAIEPQVDEVLIIDNAATAGIKKIIAGKNVIQNPQNVFVNPAWNQIMEYFLKTSHDTLIILNSDLVLRENSIDIIRQIDIDLEKTIVLPSQVSSFSDSPAGDITTIPWGYPGIMIVLTRKMCELVYPIPNDLKLWFGDDWIFGKLIKAGYSLNIYSEIESIHGGSRSLFVLPGYTDLIEEDKAVWERVKHLV
jgi:hypothetical protein